MIPMKQKVRIDLSWYINSYRSTGPVRLEKAVRHALESGHNQTGVIYDSWIEVDGERVYDVDCGITVGVLGAFGEKDLVVCPS